MRRTLVNSFKGRITEVREKIIKQVEEQKHQAAAGRILGHKMPGNADAPENMTDSEVVEEENYCLICYTNVIAAEGKPIKSDDKITIEFECKHRFCSECVIEVLISHIHNAEISKLKCFDYNCGQAISDEKLKEILIANNVGHLFEKKKRFEEQ